MAPAVDRIFTYNNIRRPPDCPHRWRESSISNVALITPVKLSDDEKLRALRRLDQFRQWHSLDEKRYCLVCGKIITGRQIEVAGGPLGNGPLRISCPTESCNSIPMDWVLPTDEILAKVEQPAAEKKQASALQPPPVINGNGKARHSSRRHDNFISRLLSWRSHSGDIPKAVSSKAPLGL